MKGAIGSIRLTVGIAGSASRSKYDSMCALVRLLQVLRITHLKSHKQKQMNI